MTVSLVNTDVNDMDFREASDRLTQACPTLADIAREAGVSDGLIRQARLDAGSPSYRNPPAIWPAAVAKLAKERAVELVKLAKELRKAAGEGEGGSATRNSPRNGGKQDG